MNNTPVHHPDMLAAMKRITNLIPGHIPSMIMPAQLHAILACSNSASNWSRTRIDMALAQLRKQGLWRPIRVCGEAVDCKTTGGYSDFEYGWVCMDTWKQWIDMAEKKLYTKHVDTPISSNSVISGSGTRVRKVRLDLYVRFKRFVVDRPEAVHVSRDELMSCNATTASTTATSSTNITEDEISELISAGFLTLKSAHDLYLSIPRAGSYVHSFLKGRQILLRLLKTTSQYQQRLRAQVETRKGGLKGCELPCSLIVLQLVGEGCVEIFETPLGDALRLTGRVGRGRVRGRW